MASMNCSMIHGFIMLKTILGSIKLLKLPHQNGRNVGWYITKKVKLSFFLEVQLHIIIYIQVTKSERLGFMILGIILGQI